MFSHRGGVTPGNEQDMVLMDRWHDHVDAWQIWIHRDGTFRRITHEPHWHFVGDLNDRSEVAYLETENWPPNLRLLRRRAPGARAFGPPPGRAANAQSVANLNPAPLPGNASLRAAITPGGNRAATSWGKHPQS